MFDTNTIMKTIQAKGELPQEMLEEVMKVITQNLENEGREEVRDKAYYAGLKNERLQQGKN